MSGTAIVTDGDQRAALAVVRSLGRAGWRLIVTGPRNRTLAGVSRFCARYLQVPRADESPEAFGRAIQAIAGEERPNIILPIAESALFALSPARGAFAGALNWLPPDANVRLVHDKRAVLAHARAVGLAVPATEVVERRGGLEGAAAGLGFPVVVRSHRSLVAQGDSRQLRQLLVQYADSSEDLARVAAALGEEAYPVLIQRRLTGAGIGVFLLIWEGRVRAAFMHRRIREKPPWGGVSVARESIPLREELVAKSARLLQEMGWSGVAMIEYKEDRPGGTPQVLEINGRFWGSLQLAIDAGVDFPLLLARLAGGDGGFDLPTYRSGIRLRWEWGEVDHFLMGLRRLGGVSPFSARFREGLRILRNLLLPVRGDRREVLRLGDLRPFLLESLNWFRRR